MPAAESVKLESVLETTDSESVWHVLRVPKAAVAHFGFKGNLRRVICTLNGVETYNCSLFPSQGDYFLTISKQLRKRLGIVLGDTVVVELKKDESKYGMPMPKEFAEVIRQDPEADALFNKLSPGDQRLMLKLIVFVKNSDRRIARALAGVELLKQMSGKFDYTRQHLAMRIAGSPNPELELERLRPKI